MGLLSAESLKQIEREFSEFEAIGVIKERIADLNRKMTAVDNRIEHAKSLVDEGDKAAAKKLIIELMKDDTELFKQFSDNEGFRRWLTDTIFGLTYDQRKAG